MEEWKSWRFPGDFFESFLRIGISKTEHFIGSISELIGWITLSTGKVKDGV
jgi:hypothetical protein